MRDKTLLRRALLAERQAIASEVRARWDAAIGERVAAALSAFAGATLGVYWPISGEPDLRQTYAELAARGVRLALPVVVERNTPLLFARWTPGDALTKDTFGVPVPASITETVPDALLIPCVGFNDGNMRLGYGGGFYDRTLARTPRPVTLGIAYSFGRTEFEHGSHDVPLDRIITEETAPAPLPPP